MIEGVKVKKLTIHHDVPDVSQKEVRPGFLAELLRSDEGLLSRFGQSTFTLAYPGTIKGFHLHERQDDLWFVATGRAMVVLYDLRPNSRTYKQTEVLDAGQDDYKLILIPVGVAHGYKVISEEPVILFYHTTEPYDPKQPDEKRIPYDDPGIGFNWSKI